MNIKNVIINNYTVSAMAGIIFTSSLCLNNHSPHIEVHLPDYTIYSLSSKPISPITGSTVTIKKEEL